VTNKEDPGQAGSSRQSEQTSAKSSAQDSLTSLFEEAVRQHRAGRLDQAEALYAQVLAINPRLVEVIANLGAIHRARGDLDRAIKAYEAALAINPRHVNTLSNLGDALGQRGDNARAEECFRRAVELAPGFVNAHHWRGLALSKLDRLDEAQRSYERAIELQPDNAPVYSDLGFVLQHQGKLKEAAAAHLRAIELKPNFGDAYYHLAWLGSIKDGPVSSETMREIMDRLGHDIDGIEPEERSKLLFAMGKTFDRLGEFDRAFEALAQANAILRTMRPFDIAREEHRLQSIIDAFDARLIERLSGEGLASDRPIFIVGMPRSGTTLVEQIISAHPEVEGAGELSALSNLVERVSGRDRLPYPAWVGPMNGADCRIIGQAYLDRLSAAPEGKTRLTDKWLTNYEYLGLIHACLPNARIIYCRRDPRDVAVSCFSIKFGHGHAGYSCDLAELGRYWRAFDRLMSHWRAVLPPGRILEVPYEDVVGDVETWARRLIAHCGLEWDDACLKFYESKRAVRTASFAQVRQPIYSDSLGRWKRYERHLGPLLEALGPPYDCDHSANR
jgi:tetratricopeptide (TPR) repeat protein